MLPHPINMVRVRLSGVKLKEIIAKSNKQEYMYEHAQGLGFRGIYLEDILYNLGTFISTGRYYLNGEEIEDDKEYVLGTIDMATFGRYFPILKELPKEYLMPEF